MEKIRNIKDHCNPAKARILKTVNHYFVDQKEYPASLEPPEWQWDRYRLVGKQLADFATLLSNRMNDNTTTSGRNPNALFGNNFMRSAFFTLTNERNPKLLVENNKVFQDGKHQVPYTHNLLREYIKTDQRSKADWKIRSGHYGRIRIPGTDDTVWVALFDSLMHNRDLTPKYTPEYEMAMTLLTYEIVPITSDGYVVSLEKPKFLL